MIIYEAIEFKENLQKVDYTAFPCHMISEVLYRRIGPGSDIFVVGSFMNYIS